MRPSVPIVLGAVFAAAMMTLACGRVGYRAVYRSEAGAGDGNGAFDRFGGSQGGPGITVASALESPEGIYVTWVEGANARALLFSAGVARPLASRPGAAGGVWLARAGAVTLRATDVGAVVTVERPCP